MFSRLRRGGSTASLGLHPAGLAVLHADLANAPTHGHASISDAARRLAVSLLHRPLLGRYSALDLPIVYKLVIADSALVAVALVGGMSLVASGTWAALSGIHAWLTAFGVISAVGTSAGVSYLIVRTALAPIDSLRRTAEAVRRGDAAARASPTTLSDPGVELFRRAFNEMLDDLERDSVRLQALSAGLITAQEEERERVARELHDEVGQLATAVLASLQRAKRVASATRMEPVVDEAIELASLACDRVRRVAYEMRPCILDDLGLEPALRAFIAECCGKRPGLHAELQVEGLDGRLPPSVEVALYRVVREAMSNAGRHADPTRVSVLVERRERYVEAHVEDDGIGFDVDRLLHTPGAAIGLLGMQERVAMLGGTLRVHSAPGRGTRVDVRFPLD